MWRWHLPYFQGAFIDQHLISPAVSLLHPLRSQCAVSSLPSPNAPYTSEARDDDVTCAFCQNCLLPMQRRLEELASA